MMPVIAWNAIHATRILTNAMRVLHDRCMAEIRADEDSAEGCSIAARHWPQP